jgi:hypothetical protein
MSIGYDMYMRRMALFLKGVQLKKLKTLSDGTGAPIAELIRRAIDRYLRERAAPVRNLAHGFPAARTHAGRISPVRSLGKWLPAVWASPVLNLSPC